VMKYCIRHGIVPTTHRCSPKWGTGTDNQLRARKNKAHGTHTSYWRQLRQRALERDGYQCQIQHPDICTGVATTVHLDPRLKGDHRVATLSDCKSSCKRCHGREDGRRTPRS
jgi:5-methylcytosine-specific restriction endonuclease McrA